MTIVFIYVIVSFELNLKNIKRGDFVIIAKKRGGRPSKRPSNEELAMLYQNMTAKQIGEYFGVSEYTVRNWIFKARKEEITNDSQ